MKVIILDRDGVINYDSENYIKNPDEWIPIPKSLEAIKNLNDCGFKIAIATNQSGISKKLFDEKTLNEIHKKMINNLAKINGKIDGIWFCSSLPNENSYYRKPNPGMLEDIIKKFNANPKKTFMVGDSLKDLQAISKLGGIPILVLTGNGKQTLNNPNMPKNTKIFDNLWEFSQYICNKNLRS